MTGHEFTAIWLLLLQRNIDTFMNVCKDLVTCYIEEREPMRRTKAEAEQTREAVLEAAADVFFENGVSRSTLEQIAVRAGVTRGAIYWHFKDKVELFKALQDSIRLPQEDLIEHAMEHGHDDPIGLIESGCLSVLTLIAGDERRQRIFAIISQRCEYVGEMAGVLSRLGGANDKMYDRVFRLMQMAERSGSLSQGWTADVAARALQCTMGGLLNEWLRSDKAFSLGEVGTKMVTELVRSLRGVAPPSR
jgi:TetR/AcrR family acrAB operon transcriptional repressor